MKPEWDKGEFVRGKRLEIEHGGLHIVIWLGVNEKWYITCKQVNLEIRRLSGCETAEEAKSEAVRIVRERLANLLRAANELPA